MKRDWECVRAILAQLEAKPDSASVLHPRDVEGWPTEVVSYHMLILNQARLIQASCRSAPGAPIFCVALGLQWEGHELLDLFRKPEQWNRVRAVAVEKGIEVSFESIKTIAAWVLQQMVQGRLA